MKKPWLPLFLFLICLWACRNGADEEEQLPDFYRQQMRLFVQAIATYARNLHRSFLVIPQNGHELITRSGSADGELAADYCNAISGLGREDLFYGYDRADEPTPAAIPGYPAMPYRFHQSPVATLAQARNFLYLISPGSFPDKNEFLDALRKTDFDLLVVDLFFDSSALSAADISSLKTKAGGGSRLVVCYLSIGEAENYRYYWQVSWKSTPPSWLDKENSQWPGNYKVRYWEKGWQEIITGNDASYLKKILDSGFDGVYLDLIDAFEYWEEKR